MSTVKKRKHETLTLNVKMDILRELDSGVLMSYVARAHNMARATIYDIKKNRDKIENFIKTVDLGTGRRQTVKTGGHPLLEEALYSWFLQERGRDTPITAKLLRQKALSLYEDIYKKNDFRASDGWLTKFKARYGIRILTTTGERLPSDVSATYGVDGNGFSRRLLPLKTYVHRGETSASCIKTPHGSQGNSENSSGFVHTHTITPQVSTRGSQDETCIGSTSSLPPEKQRKLVTRKHPKTPPGPKNAPEELLELTFIKEEPSTSDNEVALYEPTFVDVSVPSTIEDGPFIKSEPPETITAESPDETFSKYSEPTRTQSPQEVQSCMTSKNNSASNTSLRPSEPALEPPPLVLLNKSSPRASISGKSTEQRNPKKKRSLQESNDGNETLPIFQTDVPEAEVRVRVAELQVEQMKKEYEVKMKNQQIIAEQFKKEHEAKMKEHELKMKKVKGQIVEMEFRCQEMMKQSVIENKVHELTVMDLEQKLSTSQIIHELTVQELKQKLYNSQLEQQILEKKLNAHPS